MIHDFINQIKSIEKLNLKHSYLFEGTYLSFWAFLFLQYSFDSEHTTDIAIRSVRSRIFYFQAFRYQKLERLFRR